MNYCYLENGRGVFVPDVRIPKEDLHRYTPVPLRGRAYTMACVNNETGEIDGWCIPEDFGFSTVREWMEAQKD